MGYIFKHLYVGDLREDVIFLGYRLNLTPAEHRIMMLISQRERVTTEDICAEFDKSLSRGNVAVHICGINSKAKCVSGRKLVEYKSRHYYFNEFM